MPQSCLKSALHINRLLPRFLHLKSVNSQLVDWPDYLILHRSTVDFQRLLLLHQGYALLVPQLIDEYTCYRSNQLLSHSNPLIVDTLPLGLIRVVKLLIDGDFPQLPPTKS